MGAAKGIIVAVVLRREPAQMHVIAGMPRRMGRNQPGNIGQWLGCRHPQHSTASGAAESAMKLHIVQRLRVPCTRGQLWPSAVVAKQLDKVLAKTGWPSVPKPTSWMSIWPVIQVWWGGNDVVEAA